MKHKRPRSATAIRYRSTIDNAPRVTASGRGLLADRILALAAENGVPVVTDPNLADLLAALDLDVEIPSSLYRAVAEVLVWVYGLDAEAKQPRP